jgi:hypothetical protein
MPSAAFTANGKNSPVTVTAGATVTLALASITGVNLGGVEWSIVGGSDSSKTQPVITSAGSTATFTMNGDASATLGLSWIVKCRINGGVDADQQLVSAYTQTLLVGVVNANGVLPIPYGEALERDSSYGYTSPINTALAANGTPSGSGGTGNVVTAATPVPSAASGSAWADVGPYLAPASANVAITCVLNTTTTGLTTSMRLWDKTTDALVSGSSTSTSSTSATLSATPVAVVASHQYSLQVQCIGATGQFAIVSTATIR